MALEDFDDFTSQLEDLHNRVHVWVGGTMSEIPVAAFDPVFWAHHTMIDRLWAIWQQAHPGAGVGSVPAGRPLGPVPHAQRRPDAEHQRAGVPVRCGHELSGAIHIRS